MSRYNEAAQFKGEPIGLSQNFWNVNPGSMLPSHKAMRNLINILVYKYLKWRQ